MRVSKLTVFVASVAISSMLLGCGQQGESAEAARLLQTPEGKLAAIDTGTRNVSESMVQPYRSSLDNLQRQCMESRDRISDFSVVGVENLTKVGNRVTLLQFLNMMEGALPDELGTTRLSCAEIAAALVVLSTGR